MAPAIELRSVVKDYGRVRALRGIDLTVEAGQIFGFLGPNGAGKTTTIRILLDLIRPTSGTARVLGLDSQRDSVEVRRRCGYLPGDLRMYEGMRGSAFLDLIDSFRPQKRDPHYRRELLERLELDASMPIRALSKGNKQKLGLVQALMHRPDVLILDEPTSGLDPLVQQEVAKLLEEAVADGRTVFFSSHVLPEVERLSHAVAIIRQGDDRGGGGHRAAQVAGGARAGDHLRGAAAGRPLRAPGRARAAPRRQHRPHPGARRPRRGDQGDCGLPRRRPADGAAEPGGLLPRPLLRLDGRKREGCATG